MAVTFGLDISHHQDLGLDLARCKREGINFVFIKATEGSTYVDAEFALNLAEAGAAGLLVAAYHYVLASASAAAQVDHISRVVPKSVPVILDVEKGSGGLPLTRDLINRLRQAGFRVPFLYLPRWYWQQIGSPSLVGLPPLWSSRYPDNVVGSITDEFADVPASYWTGYGGLDVSVLQFTSSAAIAGYQPLDANAFRGTPAQLAALLGGTTQEDDMYSEGDRELAQSMAARVDALAKGLEQSASGPDKGEGIPFTTRFHYAIWRLHRLLQLNPELSSGTPEVAPPEELPFVERFLGIEAAVADLNSKVERVLSKLDGKPRE